MNPLSASVYALLCLGSRAFSRLKNRCNMSLPYQLPVCLGLFIPGGTQCLIPRKSLPGNCLKKYPGEGEEILSLSGHKLSGPSGHSPGPLGVCNPNEKQKPPPPGFAKNGGYLHERTCNRIQFEHICSSPLFHRPKGVLPVGILEKPYGASKRRPPGSALV